MPSQCPRCARCLGLGSGARGDERPLCTERPGLTRGCLGAGGNGRGPETSFGRTEPWRTTEEGLLPGEWDPRFLSPLSFFPHLKILSTTRLYFSCKQKRQINRERQAHLTQDRPSQQIPKCPTESRHLQTHQVGSLKHLHPFLCRSYLNEAIKK